MTANRTKSDSEEAAERAANSAFAPNTESHERQRLMEQSGESTSGTSVPSASATSGQPSTTASRVPSNAHSMPPPVNNERHDRVRSVSKAPTASYFGYSTRRMANKQKMPTRKYLMSFLNLGNSQVLEVDKGIFTHIARSNRLVKLRNAVDCALKVFDPAWVDYEDDRKFRGDRMELLSMRYQVGADKMCNEMEIYQRISDKQIAPRLLAFGVLEDPVCFEIGPRFQGPFFMMEKIEMHEKPWKEFTKEEMSHLFVKAKEKFQTLWDCNIVHGDIAFGNILLDKNGEITLVDFGSSRITEDPKEFEKELRCLERLFSIK